MVRKIVLISLIGGIAYYNNSWYVYWLITIWLYSYEKFNNLDRYISKLEEKLEQQNEYILEILDTKVDNPRKKKPSPMDYSEHNK